MNEQDRYNLFSELIVRHQSELYGYIYAVVRNWGDADDLFQAVCLVLWSKFESFRPGSSFFAWARQTAKITVSNFLKHKRLPNHVSEELLDDIAETVIETQSGTAEPYLAALRRCRAKLSSADEELLDLHYVENLGSRQIADRLRRPQPSVCHSLNRIRCWLLQCIRLDMAQQEHVGDNRS
jgi:RNA polymerase sigma-70 factor, ECF subfamily